MTSDERDVLVSALLADIGTAEKYNRLVFELQAEIDRLRLTDAEREAVRFCVTASLPETEKLGGVAGELCRMHAARLRGLLERTGGKR